MKPARARLLILLLNSIFVVHGLAFLLAGATGLLVALLGAAVAFSIAAGAFWLWADDARWERLRTRISPNHGPVIILAVGWLFVLGIAPLPDAPGPHLAHKHAVLTHVLTLLLAYAVLFPDAAALRRTRLWVTVLLLLAGLIVLVRALGVTISPFIDWQDEPWVMGWTLNYLRTGQFGDPTLLGLGDAYYAYPRFYLLMAGWFDVFGAGLLQGRLLGMLLTLPVIGFSYAAARNWFGRTAALFTAVTLLASAVLLSAARIRHDIGLAICVAAALWLHTEGVKREKTWLHALAGLICGLGMFSHYHAVGFTGALLIGLYLPRMVTRWRLGRRWPESGAIAFAVGGMAGGLTVVLLQMLPDNLPGFLWALTRQSKFSESAGELNWAFIGNFITIGFFSAIELTLLMVGVATALARRSQADISLLLILLLGHLALGVMASGAIYYYILPLTPVYAMLIAGTFVPRSQSDDSASQRGTLARFALCITPLLAATTGPALLHTLSGGPIALPAPPAAEWVAGNVPADATIAGDLRYYLWLHEYRFGSHLTPEYLTRENFERFDTIPQVWAAADVDVYLIDRGYPRSMKYFEPLMASDYWAEAGYALAARVPSPDGRWETEIYARPGALDGNP